MVKIMVENPIRMDDLGVPLFLETPILTCKIHGPWCHNDIIWNSDNPDCNFSGLTLEEGPWKSLHIELTKVSLEIWRFPPSKNGGDRNLGGGFKYFLFSSLFGEMIQFD